MYSYSMNICSVFITLQGGALFSRRANSPYVSRPLFYKYIVIPFYLLYYTFYTMKQQEELLCTALTTITVKALIQRSWKP